MLEVSEDDSVSSLLFLLRDLFKVLINNGYSEQNTCARSDSSHEVGKDAKSTNANSTEGGSGVDVLGELFDHRRFPPAFDHELLVHKLAHDVAGRLSGDINPESGKESARGHDECVVEERVEGISLNIKEVPGRTDVVSESTNGGGSSGDVVVRPLANETDKIVALVLSVEDLREEVEVAHEGRLENNGDVRGIEQFDGIRHFVTTDLSVGECEFDAEALEVDNYKEHDHSRQ